MNIFYEFSPAINKNDNNIIIMLHEKWMYQIMWELRKMEEEIKAQGGRIIIISDYEKTEFEVLGFSDELTHKIYDNLMLVDFINPLL